MNKRHVFYVGLVLLAALALFGAPLAAVAAHPDVTLRDTLGNAVSGTTPYSPKMTCSGCHFNCATNEFDNTKTTWCTSQSTTNLMDYAYGTSVSNHVQGGGSPVALSTYTITGPMHGASTGFHSTHGRNEETTNEQRTIWMNPASISSPGMWGRF